MLSGRLPKVLQARMGARQPTVFLRAARTPRSGVLVNPRLCAEVLETKCWVQLHLEPVWHTEQKLSPKTKQASDISKACQQRGSTRQQIFISAPGFVFHLSPPRVTSWTQSLGGTLEGWRLSA